MSTNENEYSKSRIVLNSLINENNKIKGIVMMSAFSLPRDKNLRLQLYKNLFQKRKKMFFIFENTSIKKKGDENKIEDYLIFNTPFFTDVRSSLQKNEKKLFVNKKFSFI